MTFERFDVLEALFPFVDLPHRKPRPVLTLSSGIFNAAHGHVLAAMITTGAGSRWPSDHPTADLAAAGLRHKSVVRWKVFTLSFAGIDGRLGHLAESDRQAIAAAIDAVLLGRDTSTDRPTLT